MVRMVGVFMVAAAAFVLTPVSSGAQPASGQPAIPNVSESNVSRSSDCQACIPSMCPSCYEWIGPGDDILAFLPDGFEGCTPMYGCDRCDQAIPCQSPEPVNVSMLEQVIAIGSEPTLRNEIAKHQLSLSFAKHRSAVAVKGCNGRLIALIPVTPMRAVAVAKAFRSRSLAVDPWNPNSVKFQFVLTGQSFSSHMSDGG